MHSCSRKLVALAWVYFGFIVEVSGKCSDAIFSKVSSAESSPVDEVGIACLLEKKRETDIETFLTPVDSCGHRA